MPEVYYYTYQTMCFISCLLVILYFAVTKQKSVKQSNGVNSVMAGGDPGNDTTVSKTDTDYPKGVLPRAFPLLLMPLL